MEAGLTYKKPSCIAARGRICNLFLEQVRVCTCPYEFKYL